jgi:CRISPR/Cas system CSM-associated protein Csm3 (group 7 of RAMP superfamily)
MPQKEDFWNPYRWVQTPSGPIAGGQPAYHHRLEGLAGQLSCEVEALTPLLIGDGSKGSTSTIHFMGYKSTPFIPGTSLKGAIRALAELVGHAAAPFDTGGGTSTTSTQLDIAGRMFGFLKGKRSYAGLVRFSDARMVRGSAPGAGSWPTFTVAGGTPKPAHRAFYPDQRRRKFYHHRAGCKELLRPHANIKEDQKRTVQPAPPGARFPFNVDFFNLREDELSLLLYCLALEEDVTVRLSPAALAAEPSAEPMTLHGPLRHKLGGCKPQGAGSVHIRIDQLELREDPAARYRGAPGGEALTGERLGAELARRTSHYRSRTDPTMMELRAMLVYTTEDRRGKNVDYPTYRWFGDNPTRPLKPTL